MTDAHSPDSQRKQAAHRPQQPSLTNVPTAQIQLTAELIEHLKLVAPKKKRSKARWVIGIVLLAGLAFVAAKRSLREAVIAEAKHLVARVRHQPEPAVPAPAIDSAAAATATAESASPATSSPELALVPTPVDSASAGASANAAPSASASAAPTKHKHHHHAAPRHSN